MPVFSHHPASVLVETGEICVLVSETAQRNRGELALRAPGTDDTFFLCRETPHRRERLTWLFTSVSQGIPLEPILTPVLIQQKDSQKGGSPATLRYLRHAQGLELTYQETTKEFHLFFWWNLYTPPPQSPPQTPEESQVHSFLSTYKNLPVSWTLSLDQGEPHATQLLKPDPKFPGAVGDPPLDPGGAWPGIYNGFDSNKILSVGGASWSKNLDPFQASDAHQSLPASPGLILSDRVQTQGALVTLGAIDGSLNDDTQHLYYQREVQASRMATRALMFTRGFLYNLVGEEQAPDPDDITITGQGLSIGSTDLTPAIQDESYVGVRFITIQDSHALFPFGVALPGFVSPLPGPVGHQFKASGGQEPYIWSLRRTRSSSTDPARIPLLPSSPPSPPYPFDDHGDLIDPAPDDPVAVQGGGLPPGMLLDQDGLLYGTPSLTGTFLFRLHVRDHNGLRGESTIKLTVIANEGDPVSCSTSRGFPVVYKTTITQVEVPSLVQTSEILDWEGRVQAVGGQTGKYHFFFPTSSDPPRQQIPQTGSTPVLILGVGDGVLRLSGVNTGNFSSLAGVWVFEIQATEVPPSGTSPGSETCDRRAVSMAIGTTRIAGISDSSSSTPDGVIPEGKYQASLPERTYLVFETPQLIQELTQGKNTYLRGNSGFPLRPDLGGLTLNPGIVTSVNPGSVNPVQAIGIQVDPLSPAHVHEDWSNSNPTDYFREIYDRFDPVPGSPLPPAPPGSSSITGSQIDDQIPIGKRIRPLWPV